MRIKGFPSERLDERGERIIWQALKFADKRRSAAVRTHHLLLALLFDGNRTTASILKTIGVNATEVYEEIKQLIPHEGDAKQKTNPPWSVKAQEALRLAWREAQAAEDGFVGTEHLFLGVLAVGEGGGFRALANCGVTLERAREAVWGHLGKPPPTLQRRVLRFFRTVLSLASEVLGRVQGRF